MLNLWEKEVNELYKYKYYDGIYVTNDEYLNDLVEYENSKLDCVEYPPFVNEIKEVRTLLGIPDFDSFEVKVNFISPALYRLKHSEYSRKLKSVKSILSINEYDYFTVIIKKLSCWMNMDEKQFAQRINCVEKLAEILSVDFTAEPGKTCLKKIAEELNRLKDDQKLNNNMKRVVDLFYFDIENEVNVIVSKLKEIEFNEISKFNKLILEMKKVLDVGEEDVFEYAENYIIYSADNYSYNYINTLKDEFFKHINIMINLKFKKRKQKEIIYNTICWHIFFGEELPNEEILNSKAVKLFGRSPFWLKRFSELISLRIKSYDEFDRIIIDIRKKLGVKLDKSINSIVYNYNSFQHYLYGYDSFQATNNKLIQIIYDILKKYDIFNVNSELDYLLIFEYLVCDRRLTKSILKNYKGTGKVWFYKGEDFINKTNFDRESLYVKIPIYTNENYLKCIQKEICAQSLQHYGLAYNEGFRGKFKNIAFYRNKYIYDLCMSKKKELKKKKITNEVYDLVINELEINCRRIIDEQINLFILEMTKEDSNQKMSKDKSDWSDGDKKIFRIKIKTFIKESKKQYEKIGGKFHSIEGKQR